MRSDLSHREDARQRFFAEAEILAGLDHPGTTAVFEAGRLPDGDCFYAMKKVSGRTLGALLGERTADQINDRAVRARLLEIFFRVCQTVASAHKQGVIHRDLKPENIMVDDLGVVYVMDWGLAKALTEEAAGSQSDSGRTRAGAVMGTPAYMSPEQASGHADTSDRQTDVFSLGVMLYEILTGTNPFRGATAVESMKGVMYHDPEAPRERNKRINRTLSAITMKALAKDPFRRYRSAVELAEDIRRYREFLPVSAIEPSRSKGSPTGRTADLGWRRRSDAGRGPRARRAGHRLSGIDGNRDGGPGPRSDRRDRGEPCTDSNRSQQLRRRSADGPRGARTAGGTGRRADLEAQLEVGRGRASLVRPRRHRLHHPLAG